MIQEQGLIERSRILGAKFLHELEKMAGHYAIIKEVRGRGLMLALEFNCDKGFYLDSVYTKLLEKGLLVGYKPAANLLRFYPALTITERDIERVLAALDTILASDTRR